MHKITRLLETLEIERIKLAFTLMQSLSPTEVLTILREFETSVGEEVLYWKKHDLRNRILFAKEVLEYEELCIEHLKLYLKVKAKVKRNSDGYMKYRKKSFNLLYTAKNYDDKAKYYRKHINEYLLGFDFEPSFFTQNKEYHATLS